MRVTVKPLGVVVIVAAFATALAFTAPRLLKHPTEGGIAPGGVSSVASSASGAPTASAPKRLPAPGPSADGNLLNGTTWKFYVEPGGADATQSPLAAADQPGGAPGYHFEVNRLGKNEWNVGFNNGLAGTYRNGEKLSVSFQGRSASKMQVCVLLQRNAAPYPHSWKEYVTLTPEWKTYRFTAPAAKYGEGEGLLAFFVGLNVGRADLADIRVVRSITAVAATAK